MEETNQQNSHPTRAAASTRTYQPDSSLSPASSTPEYNEMQLRRRTNQPSMREISDDDEGEEEVEEEEEEEEEVEAEVEAEDEGEAEVDVEEEVEGEGFDEEDPGADGQIDIEGDDDELDDDDASPKRPRTLKIKLKLPVVPSSTSNSATPVPEEVRTRAQPSSTSKRSAAVRSRRRIQDVESSEEEDEDDDDDESTMAGPSRSTRPMTTRQAVLANVVDPSHVSLENDTDAALLDHKPNPRKKQLNETELALRREETARKRKNLSEKKLEDEKLETINRLLRKQSKPRAKKGERGTANASGGVTPVMRGGKRTTATRGGKTGRSGRTTAKASTAGSDAGDDDENEGEGNEEEVEGEEEEVDEDHASGTGSGYVEEAYQIPMFRWISTSRIAVVEPAQPAGDAMDIDIQPAEPAANSEAMDTDPVKTDIAGVDPSTNTTASVVADVTPVTKEAEAEAPQQIGSTDAAGNLAKPPTTDKGKEQAQMILSFSVPTFLLESSSLVSVPTKPPAKGPQTCAVDNCTSPRKYRLVSDWTIGACGMGHLKMLEGQNKVKSGIV